MKVLILDDEKNVLTSMSRMLSLMNHESDCYSNAKDALEAVKSGEYDFVLVDYLMPNNNGIWFMSNAEIPRKTKVLLMTAYVNRNVISRMFELGACGYLVKPFDEKELKMHLAFHAHEDSDQ